MKSKRIDIRIALVEDQVEKLDTTCEKYGYSRARLIETIHLKCAKIIEENSLMFLLDRLENIKDEPPKFKRMI